MLRPMTPTPTLHVATAAALRSTAAAYEAVARVLERRDPPAALRYLALAGSQRRQLVDAGARPALACRGRWPACARVAAVSRYEAVARQDGRYWVVDVEGVGVTQGRNLGEAREMAADLVVAIREVDPAQVSVDVTVDHVET